MKKRHIFISILLITACILWLNFKVVIHITITPSKYAEAQIGVIRSGQIEDGAITITKLESSMQTEWAQFQGMVAGSNIWSVSAVTQITVPDTTLTITKGIQQYEGIGGITLTSTPTIAVGADGQLVRIRCVSDTNVLTLQSESNFPGSSLILSNGLDFNCGKGDSILLAYSNLTTRWEEMGRIDIQ